MTAEVRDIVGTFADESTAANGEIQFSFTPSRNNSWTMRDGRGPELAPTSPSMSKMKGCEKTEKHCQDRPIIIQGNLFT